jgi:beta-lactamase class A
VHQQIGKIGRDAGAAAFAAAYYDYETDSSWSLHGDRWFHAASTIKTAVLVGVFSAAEEGRYGLDARVHVRNRFLSAADGSAFRVQSGRDASSAVYGAIGQTMRVRQLAQHMITTSNNLATNLLVDLVGVDSIRATLERLGIAGIDLRRGVEDERAFEADINNRVSANGLVGLFRAIHDERAVSPDASREMLAILHQQEFRTGIPAGLPASVRAKVAHKTGEISTIAHDSGIVYFPRRKPYVVAVLTEWTAGRGNRQETIAKVSEAIYEHLTHRDGHRERDAKEKGGGRG